MEHRFPRGAALLRIAMVLAGGFSLCAALSASSEPAKEPYRLANQFSVIQTIQVDGGKAFVQHLYRDGDKLRVDVQEGPETQIIILRKDQKKVYTILPAQKLVLESAYRDAGASTNLGLPGEAGAVWEWQGKETIHGHSCAKYLVRGDSKSLSVWLDEAGNYPLRVAPAAGKTVIDWDQYQVGPQPSNLFEPPADFRKMSMSFPERPR
ncbi:DUF4412 domain-containing protein [Methylacidimicrobium sp. B4]|uniref:DUF4412 domain-containing protein n=1 Tax=Methylacidimicrobium sp. B4 TaxID=2796139 RepID=UPI001A8E263C|nr:DUF4412 domain-containing protein [Methylacidimicrobium sp. B4]QSR84141.1 DUF4412 domain-containing protein [Methylacidimicrobium sp. B4]